MEHFHASKLKIERAKHHVNDLDGRIRMFAATDFYRVSVKTHVEAGGDAFNIEITKSLPDDLSLIIGDALHNLKSSLDVAINEIVFARFGLYDDHTRFPIRETKDDLVAAIKGGKIYQASEKVANFIVNVIKPYRGGNDAIWSLHRLNILDKHRLLLPVLQVSVINQVSAEDERGGNVSAGAWFIEGQRSLTFFPKLNMNMSLTNKGKASLLVLFDKGAGMEKEAVIPTLNYLTLVVERTLGGIEEEFLIERE